MGSQEGHIGISLTMELKEGGELEAQPLSVWAVWCMASFLCFCSAPSLFPEDQHSRHCVHVAEMPPPCPATHAPLVLVLKTN